MDLDFSFALVSSLTPRRKAEKSSPTEVSKNTRSLKTKVKGKKPEGISHQRREEKENLLPKEQPMKKDEFLKPAVNKRNTKSSSFNGRESNDTSGSFSINMQNIAVRRTRSKGTKRSEISPLQSCSNVLETCDVNFGRGNLPNQRLTRYSSDVINISSDIDEDFPKTPQRESKNDQCQSGDKRNSSYSLRSSLDVVECSFSEAVGSVLDSCPRLRSLSAKRTKVKTQPTRTSGVSETSLSTAYDSDSFQAIRRHGTRVILETPDTDQSSTEILDRRKDSLLSVTSEGDKMYRLRNSVSVSPKKNTKRKSSELNDSADENVKKYSENLGLNARQTRNSSSSYVSQKKSGIDEDEVEVINSTNYYHNKESSSLLKKNNVESRRNKKLRSSNDSTGLDMFKLESTIKDQSPTNKVKNETTKEKSGSTRSKKDQTNNDVKVSKGKNTNVPNFKRPDPPMIVESQEIADKKKSTKQKAEESKSVQKAKNRHSPTSPKMPLVLPSEIIQKFEHINKWLKDTQDKTVSSTIDPVTAEVISLKDIMPVKNKYKVSLSPRIKKKKDKAKTSLEEEQKLFEQLYGADYDKKLSDNVDEDESSCQDSVEFSENILEKLYGTVWPKDTAITQSEPKKGRRKKTVKNKTPLTERKKHRTSIYEVFSSSSSEDRFEEFLENVQRGKVESTKHRVGRPGTPDFINDSDSEDNASLVFYQNIVSSAVKDDVNSLKKNLIKPSEDKHKVNRRRLSFGSSKDDGCSESGKSDTKPTKVKKPQDTSKPKKTRSKKKNKYIEEKGDGDMEVFSLVTPIKIKGKKTDNGFSEKSTNPNELPRSVGKTRTPKSQKTKEPSSEERLKAKYMDLDFKAPKAVSTFKTPSKSVRPEVPASPALSFLSSLSEMTAGLPCHPDALVYKKNFKTKREELTKRLFTLYNKEVFDQQLPSDLLIQWNSRMTSTSGYCYNKRIYRGNEILRSSRIVLSIKILDRADRLRDTLIHELCHAATWIINATSDGHGPIWRSWADKANRRFPELPVIKRCHDYAISTKFTYKCMSCGYSIGRHSKSLDTERKRCGFCYGKFQVFVTAKMATDSVTSGSDSVKTPRNPTGFALFVKENYAIVKKENNVPHAQVMKLLSQKFAEVKISKQNTDEPILLD
ncbi:germ cell nuclear acidic protein-like [Macrosteles quadrilineatus]|uniref:germ cell nuclear acidic protein-like n=1 Tax=Macrosteles quadrilineatus TaxID=74068 RepID=UPI0023E134F3|nr:germ cell nuclear acidic protein-like [Macrosteles quadrilineatus]